MQLLLFQKSQHHVRFSYWSAYHNCWDTLINPSSLQLSIRYLFAVTYTIRVCDWLDYLAVNYSDMWFICGALMSSASRPVQQTYKYTLILVLPLYSAFPN
jgi:hypothetical protein